MIADSSFSRCDDMAFLLVANPSFEGHCLELALRLGGDRSRRSGPALTPRPERASDLLLLQNPRSEGQGTGPPLGGPWTPGPHQGV